MNGLVGRVCDASFTARAYWHGILWIALGGFFYTAGIFFYAFDRLSYFHAFWHLFVLAGSTCHYFAVLFYVAHPRA